MNNLRPQKLKDLIGQQDIKNILEISIDSARKRNDVLPPILISGPAGTGKTTLAQCIANELETNFHYINAAAIKNIRELLPFLFKIKRGDVTLIDEIHSIRKNLQEFLYTVIEDNFCILGKDENITKINIPPSTIIGATTESGLLTKPFRDRFKMPLFFSCYTIDELANLAISNANKLQIEIDKDAAYEIASRSRETPRILNRLLEWCRDFTIHRNSNKITITEVIEAMKLAKIQKNGFTFLDSAYIICLREAGRPLSINTISSILKTDEKIIKDEVEPFLLKQGLICKTTKGRILIKNDG